MKIVPKFRADEANNFLNNLVLSPETIEYKNKLIQRNRDIIPIENYKGNNTKIAHLFLQCGHIGEITPHNAYKRGCEKCNKNYKKDTITYKEQLFQNNIDLIPIEEYINDKTSIYHVCPKNHKRKMSPGNVLAGHYCKICSQLKNSEKYVEELKDKSPDIELIDGYYGTDIKSHFRCKKCGYDWYAFPSNPLRGKGCMLCGRKSIGDKLRLTNEEFLNRLNSTNNVIKIIGKYSGERNLIKSECLICGYIWDANPVSLMLGCGCIRCSLSRGELRIHSFLLQQNIPFISHKTFDNLKGVGGKLLSYDFYIPINKVAIEYQGIQHERPVSIFGGEKQFEIQKEHDKRKRQYCIDNNIKLIEIWHYDFDDIEKVLIDELNIVSVETAGCA